MASGTFNNWSKIGRALEDKTPKVVRKLALDFEGHVKKHIVANNQVDTSFMLNSPYVVTANSSDYKGGERALPEVPRPGDPNTAYGAIAAEYAAAQNYGTSHLPPRPFWEPAIEDIKPGADAAMQALKEAAEEAAQ